MGRQGEKMLGQVRSKAGMTRHGYRDGSLGSCHSRPALAGWALLTEGVLTEGVLTEGVLTEGVALLRSALEFGHF